MPQSIIIRPELPSDIAVVHTINELAFGQPLEAEIVDRIRANCPDILSLVAVTDDQIVGHILFSPAEIRMEERTIPGMGLAPMAVHPDFQNRSIGSQLVRAGLALLIEKSCPFVIVLGHPNYYPRFGFKIASTLGIACQWPVPDEAFMILQLDEEAMAGVTGVAYYRSEFNEAV